MIIQFLFLPYVGYRSYDMNGNAGQFFMSGPRYTPKPDTCLNCNYYYHVPAYETRHRCKKGMTCHGEKIWEKHPCKVYSPRGVLKKL